MAETEFDELLARIDRASSTPASLDDVVARSRAAAPPRRVTRRAGRRLVLAGAGLAVMGSLIAGVGYQDYLLSVPPYVGLEEGGQRATSSMLIEPALGQDRGEPCRLYPEFLGLTPEQLEAVNTIIDSRDWHQWALDLADEAVASVAAGTYPELSDAPIEVQQEVAYSDALVAHLHSEMSSVVPGLLLRMGDGSAPVITGYSMNCRPGIENE